MDKSDPPVSFGVFKPVGHVVVALPSAEAQDALAKRLLAQGFSTAALVRYSPEDMVAQVDLELLQASPLAAFGQELNLAKAHRAMALAGCSFLVVHAPDDEQAQQVADAARQLRAASAQYYGRLIIETLIEPVHTGPQGAQRPDQGLAEGPELSTPN